MPRGGPDASWLDRKLQTDRLEYTDRSDVPGTVKEKIVAALVQIGTKYGTHEANSVLVANMVADIPEPRILELGAGHGLLSRRVLELHPGASVTVTDIDPALVAGMAAGPLGAHPRATVRAVDATAIDAPDDSFDLVVFAAAFHHLPPAAAARAIAEGTRVGAKFLVVDGIRPTAGKLLLRYLTLPPIVGAVMLLSLRTPLSAIGPTVHDSFITCLRHYSRSAFETLAAAADSPVAVEFPATDRIENDDHPVIFTRS
ncbi:class I SAM-dependent methyltransferase [Nocardia sp. 2]|uniref:Class I SAM-dependent methyltransferase n=1 Tax=Nocardia acididurans TaxID=2802282 RepID=A0ABS1MAN6_9NOCA|nr:class I SAM-dependent methyltransferase [Nocardia acididurans]MBL1077705.1 class I SAM-dependent methyltransferase [Nocardia acididurans]